MLKKPTLCWDCFYIFEIKIIIKKIENREFESP